jgi:hypothetical protein
MSEVIRWALTGGFLIFGLGLISAIGSRRRHKAKSIRVGRAYAPSVDPLIEESPIYAVAAATKVKKDGEPISAMSMAASGLLNGEENLASVGNHPR